MKEKLHSLFTSDNILVRWFFIGILYLMLMLFYTVGKQDGAKLRTQAIHSTKAPFKNNLVI
ncbi:hypothetical protein H8S90_15325 [Olivibacter sp. SDN3]|uniref:hypothetical protein n=1 Tax=Olivibacter sp. SDN3 TaxID=2764720 RepID=UPI0016516060|nr:hypothetical protein [Olivibacter sp. SDN3]QNL48171.1 hypothetical protein H8S90_15325 [Olivibacter sp. SDN3]